MKKIVLLTGIFFLGYACMFQSTSVKASTIKQDRSNIGITFNGYEGSSDIDKRSNVDSDNKRENVSRKTSGINTLPTTNEKQDITMVLLGLITLVVVMLVFNLKKNKKMEDL